VEHFELVVGWQLATRYPDHIAYRDTVPEVQSRCQEPLCRTTSLREDRAIL